jgi:hypothetical protein
MSPDPTTGAPNPPAGASQAAVVITEAIPPPVAAEGGLPRLPPGVPTLLTAGPADKEAKVNRNTWRVSFAVQQGFHVVLRRIAVRLAMKITENKLQKTVVENETQLHFKTEGEAQEHFESLGGVPGRTVVNTPGTFSTPKRTVTTEYTRERVGTVVNVKEKVTETEAVFPNTATLTVRLVGPEGEIWTTTTDVALHLFEGIDGFGFGTATEYADLTNALSLDAQSGSYGFQLELFLPTTVETEPVVEAAPGETVPRPESVIRVFYDIEPVALNK